MNYYDEMVKMAYKDMVDSFEKEAAKRKLAYSVPNAEERDAETMQNVIDMFGPDKTGKVPDYRLVQSGREKREARRNYLRRHGLGHYADLGEFPWMYGGEKIRVVPHEKGHALHSSSWLQQQQQANRSSWQEKLKNRFQEQQGKASSKNTGDNATPNIKNNATLAKLSDWAKNNPGKAAAGTAAGAAALALGAYGIHKAREKKKRKTRLMARYY